MKILSILNSLILGSFTAFFYTGCSKQDLDPNVELNKAVTQAENGDWEIAGETAKKLINNVKDNSDAFVIYGLTLENQEKYEDAIEAFKLAVENDKSNFYGYYNAGRIYYKLKNYPEATKYLREALTLKSQDINTKLLLAQSLTPQLFYDDAIALYKQLAVDPKFAKSSEVHNQLGVLYSRAGKKDKAFSNLKKAYILDRNNPEAVYNLAIFIDNKEPNTNKYRKFKLNLLTSYLKLTKDNSQLQSRRNNIKKRIKKIMRPS